MKRRTFVQTAALTALAGFARAANPSTVLPFQISLAQWSLHRALAAGSTTTMDFPAYARGIGATGVEYVNSFLKGRATDISYLAELKNRAEDQGVRNVLIMCDGEGQIGDKDERGRAVAVNNHKKWIEAAQFLGCHAIRVNAQSTGTPQEQHVLVVDGLSRLGELGKSAGISVIVENHGGLTSDGAWLAGVLKAVGMPCVGSLPDFGNFHDYDRYQGIQDLMPYAKGVSAKSHEFNSDGEETATDFEKAMRLVLASGYRGFVGIEYEGNGKSEADGILATRDLLIKVGTKLAADYPPADNKVLPSRSDTQ